MCRLKRDFNLVSTKKTGDSKDYSAVLFTYQRPIPSRMPAPHGPLQGADMSTNQLVTSFNTSTNVGSGAFIVQNGSTSVMGSIAFRLDDLDQVATFSSLFDQYRIDRVHLRIRPRNNSVFLASTASPNQASPVMFVVVDFDDATAASTVADLRQYSNCIELNTSDSADIILKPAVTPAVWSSGAFSGYSVEGSRWIDVANTAVPHFGVKFGVTALQLSATYSWAWDVEAWYTVSFRAVR